MTEGLGRRAQRRQQRRQQRRRLLAGTLAVAVVVLAVVTVVLIRRHDVPPRTVAAQARTQQTVLLQVRGPDGSAVASAVLAHDPASRTGAVVLVPPQLIVNVPGAGAVPFGRVIKTSPETGARNALSDLIGVTLDGGWLLDLTTLGHLVDLEGGVQVTVDAPVVTGTTIVLQPGRQQLDGAHATAFATYLAAGEQEQTRLARLQAVLDGILTALPDKAEPLLGSLGPTSVTTLPARQLADLLTGLRRDDKTSDLQYDSLPVIKIDAGTDEIRFRIDAAASTALVDRLLAQSVPAGARSTGNRVLVLNGVGTPGIGEKVRSRLVPAGLVFVGSRNAEHFGYATRQVLIRDATPESQALGAKVATALGLPQDDVRTADLGALSDVVVLVGADFAP